MVADLVAIARTMPREVIKAISVFDSQMIRGDEVKHLAALEDLLTTYDCRLHLQPDTSWYPSEPIELASYAVDGQSVQLAAYCNVLLMIDDLEDGRMDHMDYRYTQTPGAAWFEALPDPFRVPLLEGFALLQSWDGEPLRPASR